VARLREVSPASPGWARRRAGAGFIYLDADGRALPAEDVARVKALVIPPAWQDVWICPVPHGHLQAVGTDAAGRRQYLYHPEWRTSRDEEKFDRVARAAPHLPRARRRIAAHLGATDLDRRRACATAARLLDLGCFRVGGDSEFDSFGLTTLERRHLRTRDGTLVFTFTGKSEIEQRIEIDDPAAARAVEQMRRRRGGDRLLVWKDARRWRELTAEDVNDYLADIVGSEFTAKDFRTWHATVLAAVALAETGEPGDTQASRRRAVRAAMDEVAEFLGNSAAIARSSYVDPRVVERYEAGVTIGPMSASDRRTGAALQAARERAVLRLLDRT
jgi:DNA topoisomerase-1